MLILSVFLSGESASVRFICRCSLSLYLIDFMMPCVIHADFLCLCLLNLTVLVVVYLLMSDVIVFWSKSQLSVGSMSKSGFIFCSMFMFCRSVLISSCRFGGRCVMVISLVCSCEDFVQIWVKQS